MTDRFAKFVGDAVADIRAKYEEVFYGRRTTERFHQHFSSAEIERAKDGKAPDQDRSLAKESGWDIDR
jgi:hypothetical protein